MVLIVDENETSINLLMNCSEYKVAQLLALPYSHGPGAIVTREFLLLRPYLKIRILEASLTDI